MLDIRAIVTDIEGTTTPIAFVRDVLFPYARDHLAGFLQARADDPVVMEQLAQVRILALGQDPEAALRNWIEADAKITPLKTLQGLIWEDAYRRGVIRSPIYPDVAPSLMRWRDDGRAVFVYSSGSIAAQRLLFGFSDVGDLQPLFSGYFDTTIGGKREQGSYRAIAVQIGFAPENILFLSDIAPELDAAKAAGWQTTQLVRVQDGTIASPRHDIVADFGQIAL